MNESRFVRYVGVEAFVGVAYSFILGTKFVIVCTVRVERFCALFGAIGRSFLAIWAHLYEKYEPVGAIFGAIGRPFLPNCMGGSST